MRQTKSLLGLDDHDIAVYRFLLGRPAATITDISGALPEREDQVRASCDRLVSAGLVSTGREDGMVRVVPTAVDTVTQRLTADADTWHAQRIGQISVLRSELSQTALEQVAKDGDEYIDVIRNAVAAQLKTTELLAAARRQVLILQGSMRGPAWRRVWTDSCAALDRGVEVNAICTPDPDPDADPELARARDLGAQVRVTADVPATLLVIDHTRAVVRDLAQGIAGIAIVRGTGVLTTLATLFAGIWRTAEISYPAGRPGTADHTVDEREFQILRLLSIGMKDESIAKQVGLSVRTVRRTISTVMARLGVTSRFELATLCVRKGWL